MATLETEEQPPGALMSNTSIWQVLTPKQLLLLAQSTSPRDSWTLVSTLLVQLIKFDLLRYKDVQEQAVAVVRQEWPQVSQLFTLCSFTPNVINYCFFRLFGIGTAESICDLRQGHCRLASQPTAEK